jgi:predicted SpoU family rRNA methylase
MENSERVIAFADKTVLSISGLKIKGLNTQDIEDTLSEKLNTVVRVIGVTGDRIEMDVYGITPENIDKDEDNIIKAVACIEGVTLTELAEITENKQIKDADIEHLPDFDGIVCGKEKWL